MTSTNNITFRTKTNNQVKARLNKSDNNIPQPNTSQSSEMELSYTSIPNVSLTENNTIYTELKNEISLLQAQLNTANQEIRNLNEQNMKLKHQITKYEQKNIFLNTDNMILNDCTSPIKATVQTKHRRHQRDSSTPIKSNSCTSLTLQGSGTQQNEGTAAKSKNVSVKSIVANNRRKMVYILGDQHAAGLYKYFLDSKQFGNEDTYCVSSFIKPGSLCSETLINCDNLLGKLKDGDIVVISIGGNDKNPYNILNTLSASLNKLQSIENIKIYITQVTKNIYLNETYLNNHLRSLIATYRNCKFISLNKSLSSDVSKHLFTTKYSTYLTYLCKALFFEISCDTYSNKYLDPKNLKTLIKCYENKYLNKQKGTIPYYFKKKSDCTKIDAKNNDISTYSHICKRGTIPYYFHKVNKTSKQTKQTDLILSARTKSVITTNSTHIVNNNFFRP